METAMAPDMMGVTEAPMTGDEIKALRDRLGWTQEQLARRLGVSFTTINRWERGRFQASPMAVTLLRQLQDEQEKSK